MRDEVAAFLTAQHITGTVHCAVSGGADSMALLDCLWQLQGQQDIAVRAVHFHHHLRPEEADRDAQFVASFCAARRIPFEMGHGDTAAYAKRHGQSLEQAARALRYAFFDALPDGYIATAHTADDNLETALMRLIRGASLHGLCGIPPVRGRLIRPMLSLTRQQVLAYLTARDLPHVEDSSNRADTCLRNRLRHQVVPLLLAENPSLPQSYGQAADRMRQEDALLDQLAAELLSRAQAGAGLRCDVLRAAPPVLQRRALLQWLRQLQIPTPGAAHVQALSQLLDSSNPSAQTVLPGGQTVARQYELLAPQPPAETAIVPTALSCPGLTPVPSLGIQVLCSDAPRDGALPLRIAGPLWLRARQPGDTIRLPGGRKTLKKLMIDRKIPVRLRDRIPVIADSAGVAAVIGIGTDLDHIPNSRDSVLYLSILEKEEI